MNTECEGACFLDGECRNPLQHVSVSSSTFKAMEFLYCQTAIEHDKQAGFDLEIKGPSIWVFSG